MSTKKKVLLGMSGGIDSSMAAILLKEAGYEVTGLTIRTYDSISESCISKEKGCCTVESIFEAKKLTEKLGISHYIIDARELFTDIVIADFKNEYMHGRTPNPCVVCNPYIKWDIMLSKADEFQCEYVATGHYAKISQNNGRYYIVKGADESKDQSYFLWMLSQEHLHRTIFPLGGLNKEEVRKLAAEKGYTKLSEKKESQEICFIPDDDYREFLKQNIPDYSDKISEGNFVDSGGKILGKHKGYPFYTIGQRKGLGIAAGYPLFVKKIIPETNTIILGKQKELFDEEMWVKDFKFMKYQTLPSDFEASVKIRFRNKGYQCKINIFEDKLHVLFHEKVPSVTPGQSAVFYEAGDVVGGGIIQAG